MKRFARVFVPCLLALVAGGVQAQVMYRCGKTFQDRPCEGGVTEQRIIPSGGSARAAATGSANPSLAASPYAIECARRGEHAQRISWQREAGATMERQINEAKGNGEVIAIIQDVYARRGSAPEIRAAIEAQCVDQRTRQAAAADAIRALQDQAGGAAPRPVATSAPAPADASAKQAPAPSTPQRDPNCSSYESERTSASDAMRRGGNVQFMEQQQNRKRDAERKLSDAKC